MHLEKIFPKYFLKVVVLNRISLIFLLDFAGLVAFWPGSENSI